jgi:tetratricopeptide (TPR) repeat protein
MSELYWRSNSLVIPKDTLIMLHPPQRPPWLLLCLLLIVLSAGFSPAQASDAAPVKKQLPADVRAYRAAAAVVDPEKRLAAMRSFVKQYPKSRVVSEAQGQILKVLLDNFPERTVEIDKQAKLTVKGSGKGDVAWALAEAGTNGVDLKLAEKLAKAEVGHLTETSYNNHTLALYKKYKETPPKPEALHKRYLNARAEALAQLADVYLREGKSTQAAALISEAFTLDPLVDDVNSQRGRLALLDHKDGLALESFERAQLVGAISTADRKKMKQLYREAHGGSEEGLDAEMDARYAQLFPSPFPAGKPATNDVHRTVLLELFTGSACGPCVGADLSLDAVLDAYPRSEVVALSFDEHIPEPDPLANPDSVARRHVYDIDSTPTFVIDGVVQELYGANRDESQEIHDKLAKLVEAYASLPSSVELKLSAEAPSGSVSPVIHAHATGQLPNSGEVAKMIAAKPTSANPATAAPQADTKAPPADAAEPQLVVNFALVEDEIRYSGENGIRFHRMVVRSLAKPADSGFPVTAGGNFSLDASFDLAAISGALRNYLDDYEQHNDQFGKITFISKDTTIRPSHLAIAAWVQDAVSHRVLQAAFIPVSQPQKEAE